MNHSIRKEINSNSEYQNWQEKYLKNKIKDFKCTNCGSTEAYMEPYVTKRRIFETMKFTHIIECAQCHKKIKYDGNIKIWE